MPPSDVIPITLMNDRWFLFIPISKLSSPPSPVPPVFILFRSTYDSTTSTTFPNPATKFPAPGHAPILFPCATFLYPISVVVPPPSMFPMDPTPLAGFTIYSPVPVMVPCTSDPDRTPVAPAHPPPIWRPLTDTGTSASPVPCTPTPDFSPPEITMPSSPPQLTPSLGDPPVKFPFVPPPVSSLATENAYAVVPMPQ